MNEVETQLNVYRYLTIAAGRTAAEDEDQADGYNKAVAYAEKWVALAEKRGTNDELIDSLFEIGVVYLGREYN
jgi:hypothetical protein